MDHLVRVLYLKEPREVLNKNNNWKNKIKPMITQSSVSQNNRQLQHNLNSFGSFAFEPSPLTFLRDFVDVTTSVNCIKLIDQAVNIR